MSFIQRFKAIIDPIVEQTVQHTFFTDFLANRLDEARFKYYIVQDCLYLRAVSRSLGALAEKTEDPYQVSLFCEHARATIIAEQGLHLTFLHGWGVIPSQLDVTEPSIDCLALTAYIDRIVIERSFAEGVAALATTYCYYAGVFMRVAKKMGNDQLRYRDWVELFQSEPFLETFAYPSLKLTEDLAAQQTPDVQEKMIQVAHRISVLEHRLFDGAYRLATWV